MGMKRKAGKTAESMTRSMDVGKDQLGPHKGFRAGVRGGIGDALKVFKGTRVGRNPDRSQKDMCGVLKPERGK